MIITKIYCIENAVNNKKYIGKTKRGLQKRFHEHIVTAGNPNSRNFCHLQKAIRYHGKENFFLYVLDQASTTKEANEKEKYWIAKLDTRNNGYNETYGGDGHTAGVFSEEHKQNLRLAKLGKKQTSEHIQNRMKHQRGRKLSPSHIESLKLAWAIRKANKGEVSSL